jgi:LmbE family N-acetylglucosaminyl deacetylase
LYSALERNTSARTAFGKPSRAASFAYGAPNVTTVPRDPASTIPHVYFCDPIESIGHDGQVVTPTTIIDITDQMDLKTRMLAAHASQREWLRAHHGMDEYVDAMHRMAAARGQAIGTTYAEAFIQYRPHAYPTNDLLADLFAKR